MRTPITSGPLGQSCPRHFRTADEGFIKLPYERELPIELMKALMQARVEAYAATGAGWNDRYARLHRALAIPVGIPRRVSREVAIGVRDRPAAGDDGRLAGALAVLQLIGASWNH
jgi:hypothetical protein